MYLETLAQIAIGLTGFTGVIVSFAAQPERWTAMDRARLSLMLNSGIAALFLAMLPLALAALGIADALLWRLASAILLVATLGVVGTFIGQMRRIDASGRREFLPQVYLPLATGTFLNLLAQAGNVMGWFARADGVYVAGLTWSLLPAAVMFGRTVYVLMIVDKR